MSSDDKTGNTGEGAPRRQRRRRVGRRRRRRAIWVTGWVAAGLVLILVVAALGGYFRYRRVWTSIRRIDVGRDLRSVRRPPQYTAALNILLIGSDSRAGANRRFGAGIQGQRSDTIMLLHISPGHRRATVISIPRDSMVPVLSCAPEGSGAGGQRALPGQRERINQTFADGGPGCLWKTVEDVTGVRLDHFMELSFTGFEHVINDLGGVDICLPVAVDDPDSQLHLPAGPHHVDGREALAFWRERHIGAGSDLQRIQRDQYLMAALMQKVRRGGVLSDPARVYSLVVDSASAMTTDSGLDLTTMLKIAGSLRGLTSSSVRFVTVPEVPYPPDRQAEVEFEQPEARALFRAVAHDTRLPASTAWKREVPALRSRAAKALTQRTLSPSAVRVRVRSDSGVPGVAATAATDLAARGFRVAGTGSAPGLGHANSVIEYASAADLPAADTLRAQFRQITVHKEPGLTPGTVLLVIGSGFTGLAPRRSSSRQPRHPAGAAAVAGFTRAYGGISAATPACADRAAFSGADLPSQFPSP